MIRRSAAGERAAQQRASAMRRSLWRRLIEFWISVFISVIAFLLFLSCGFAVR